MSKQVKQIRYYSDNKLLYMGSNGTIYFPLDGYTQETFITGAAFADYMPTTHLAIQAPSGTVFYLNDNTNDIMVGPNGVFEIDVEGLTEITSLRFNNASMTKIDANPATYIIVDLVYEKEEE